MLKNFLMTLLIFLMSANLVFAGARFTEADKKKFMEEVKQGIAAHKLENKGNVDFQIIKPGLYEELDIYYKQEKFTSDEMVLMKQHYEEFIKKEAASNNKEEALYGFINKELNEINKKPVEKTKEGQACNNWSCEEGLKCAPDPKQEDGASCKKRASECKEAKDCCSGSCTLNKKSNKRYCEEVYRCFRPLALGQSCSANPVCGEGDCLAYNSKTSGIGECEEKGRHCKNDSDCCSNSCNGNKCVESYICKDCVKNGKKSDRGQKCCEGLYLNDNNMCVPDVPPVVFPQVNIKFKTINFIASIFISNSQAQDAPVETPKEEAARLAKELATTTGAKSSSPKDLSEALKTYTESRADLDKVKRLASLDVTYQDVADQAQAKIDAADAKAAAIAKQLALDNADMTGTILANKDKYSNFQSVSADADKVDVKTPEMVFPRKSEFSTCDIRFRDDFGNYLKKSKLMDLELALLAFDYMFLGDGVNDYWTKGSDPGTSIYGRLKIVARKHQLIRDEQNKKIDAINHKLTCMCLDVKGYDAITDETKKTFFTKECSEYAKYADPSTTFDELAGDASGVKGKRLLVQWTKNLETFNESLAIDNTEEFKGIAAVSEFAANEAKWNEAENRHYDLFHFHLKNPSGSVAAMGAILGALLAAGVIAVLGGFASTSILTAWALAGIIATSAITGGTGLWLIASLKGAWISKRPEVFDRFVQTYGCGKKETCQEWSRELNQPYNNICNAHTSANACIKNFLVYYDEDNQPRYLVDPWIPKDVSKSLVLRDLGDARDYSQKMEDGFQSALTAMRAKNPGASGGGGKDGGQFVAEDYMRTLFVDSPILGNYTPAIGLDDKRYLINEKIIDQIKRKAIAFAIKERFAGGKAVSETPKDDKYCIAGADANISTDTNTSTNVATNAAFTCSDDKDNLDKFAEYTYYYHFIWPKTSRQKEISYPTVGLTTYLDLMSNGVAANMAVGATNAAKKFGGLNAKHLQDYLNTLQLFKDNLDPNNQTTPAKLKLVNAEIDKTQADLANQIAFNSLSNNTNLDKQLLNASAGVNSASKIGGNASLTGDQAKFLNAVGTLRVARKAQLKKLDTFKKAIAKNGNPDRAIKIASASKSFSAKFASPLSGGKGSGLFGSGGADGLSSGSGDGTGSAKNSGIGSGSGGSGSYGASYGSGSGGRSGSGKSGSGSDGSGDGSGLAGAGGGSGTCSNKAYTTQATCVANGGIWTPGDGMSEEDRRRLADAIDARNRANKDKYSSNENDSLFQKITNAYIRNYDKVLTKKKDKDIIEKK